LKLKVFYFSFVYYLFQGYLEEGIFRLSGRLTEINAIKKKYDSGITVVFDISGDVNTVTGIILSPPFVS
jgi:hypothetical protein